MTTIRRRRYCAPLGILTAWFGAEACLAQPAPDPVLASVTLSSTYMNNGLPQTEDRASLRLAVDFEHATGFFAGGVLANVNYTAEADFGSQRDTQATIYTGYVFRRGNWMSNLALSQYVYPGFARDYDYSQFVVNVSFRERYFLNGSRSSSYLSVYGVAEQWSAGLALPIAGQFEFGASAGRFRSDGSFDVSYSWWDAGLSRSVGPIALDLRYHANTYPRANLLGNDNTDTWVLSMTYALLPSRNQGR